ncbi:uncharacterized protein F5891DRAFT_1191169 [Suillus fuscotomentosus]|uniref:Uncharacterized protein n=1 Tax=Suillus fuscotomentosus TaxID=1912939 RepID=A0AAD4HJW6_9AGAM|nr:uncharacterized protein F5891DRAFT_1191169 [Suillus fuscotomentosus]KAG1898184.1 hypothetical protein F5891DRAFT_1191169 [Suillus fuscotomentosus]
MRAPSSAIQHVEHTDDDLAKLISDAVGQAMRDILANLPQACAAYKPRTRHYTHDDGMEANTEEDNYRSKLKKIKGRPKCRLGIRNEFLWTIQEHGLLLTYRNKLDCDFYDVPTPEEVAAFDPTQGPCCMVEHFCMDSFLEAHAKYRDKTEDEVESAWMTHLAYLRNVYQRQTVKARNIEADKQHHRRKEHQMQMYYCRMGVAEGCRHLRKDGLTIIKELGIDGMSSDEFNHPPGNGILVYQVQVKHWHSHKITDLLQACDALHLRMRYGGDWDVSPGAWPHLCVPSLKHSTRSPFMRRVTRGGPK